MLAAKKWSSMKQYNVLMEIDYKQRQHETQHNKQRKETRHTQLNSRGQTILKSFGRYMKLCLATKFCNRFISPFPSVAPQNNPDSYIQGK